MRRYHSGRITELKPNSVFVFGSNLGGFHGAGAAGFAYRGDSRNTWRNDESFIKALKTPLDSPERIGKWAVLGQGKGFQRGREGCSYAIATVHVPGAKRSISLEDIYKQFVELVLFAKQHPELEFLCCVTGGGYSGYYVEEIATLYQRLEKEQSVPNNVVFPPDARIR